MKRHGSHLLALALSTFALATSVLAAPRDPAPIPEEVVRKLVYAPLAKPRDALPAVVDKHLAQSLELIQRWEAESAPPKPGEMRALGEGADRAVQVEAKLAELAGLKPQLEARTSQGRDAALAGVKGKKARAAILKHWDGRRTSLAQRHDQITQALRAVREAPTPEQRRAALTTARALLQGIQDRVRAQRDPIPAKPFPTYTQAVAVTALEEQPSDKTPAYLAQQPERLQNSYAFVGNVLLAAYSPPATPAEATSCYAGGTVPAADLADTPDLAKSDPDIQTLAEKLGYSPAKIYQWVHDNIEYEPYWGSLKGAKGALISGKGNATDQASLTIALMRASNVPARYVKGRIWVLDASTKTDGSGRVQRWLGVKTYTAAAQVLGKGNVPAGVQLINSTQRGVAMDHVWVEACVPYGQYRGAAITQAGHRWIPLDPSFKLRRYQAGVAMNTAFGYGTGSGDYLAERAELLPSERYAQDVANDAALPADKSVTDVPYTGTTDALKLDVLPASLPYRVNSFSNWSGTSSPEIASLPDTHRYKFTVTVKNGTTTHLAQTLTYPDAALKRLTLSYTPADAGSQTWWNTWNGDLTTLPGGTVNLKPVLKLEGVEQGSATGSLSLGTVHTVIMKLTLAERSGTASCIADTGTGTDPDTTCANKAVYNNIKAGAHHALGASAFQFSDAYLKARAQKLTDAVRANPAPTPATPTAYDATVGELLHLNLMKYMRYWSDGAHRIAGLMGATGGQGFSIGLTASDLKVEYLYDLPYAVHVLGPYIDFKGGQSNITKLDTTTGASSETWAAFKLSGYEGSALEHHIWQETLRTDAVSTVRGMQYAVEQGGVIRTFAGGLSQASFDSQWASQMDASMAAYKASIWAYVSAGSTVTVPNKAISYTATGQPKAWNGAVYMAENQTAGTSGALIQGSLALAGGFPLVTPADLGESYVFESNLPGSQGGGDSFVSSLTGADGWNPYLMQEGDPVNLVTGSFYHVERDMSIPGRGGLPLVFERHYNSRDARTKNGPLGYGWTHSFNHTLRFHGVEGGMAKVSWTDGTGGAKFFATAAHAGGNLSAGTPLTNPAGVHVGFQRQADGSYTITEKNGLTYTFESVNATATDTGQQAKLLSIADRNGNTLSLAYNADATLQDVSDGPGRKLAFTYTATAHGARLTRIEFKKAGGTVIRSHEYTHDAAGNLISHQSPATLADPVKHPPVAYQYYTAADGANLDHTLKQYQLPRGNGMAFHYYANGKVFRHAAFGPGGEDLGMETSFTYNDFRRETVVINERGHSRSVLFDAHGNPISLTEENGATRAYAYDPAQPLNRVSKTDPFGLTTQYTYDALGNVTQLTQPDGNSVSFHDYNAFNQPKRIQDARSNWTLLRYDTSGNLTDEVKLRAGAAAPTADVTPLAADVLAWSKVQYDGHGNRTGVKRLKTFAGATLGNYASGAGPSFTTAFDANGLYPTQVSRVGDQDGDGVNDPADTETLSHDDQGRSIRSIDADWQVVERQFDAVDRVVAATDALGHWRQYQYDANGNPLAESLTVGGAQVDSAAWAYDGADRRVLALDAGGHASTWEYDAVGNPVKITDPDGYSLAFDYDAAHRWVAAYDKEGNRVARNLDVSGRVRAVTDPNGNARTTTWWDQTRNGRLKEAIDALGHKTSFDWDAHGNRITVTDNLGQTSKTHYDALDRPVREVGPLTNGAYPVTCNKYDPLGHLAEIWAGSTYDPDAPTCDLTGADPNLKKQATYVINDFGWKVKETDPLGQSKTWTRDRHGNVLTATDARGQQVVNTWGYGHQLLTRTVKNSDGSVYRTVTYTRNALGQPEQISQTNPALTTTYSHDAAHRVKSVADSRGNKTLTHDWSPGGLLNTTEDGDGNRTDYLYDAVGRLTGVWAPNFDYVAFSHDAGGRLTEKWFPNGLTARYEWNADDSLKKLTNRVNSSTVLTSHQYTYDTLGRRTRHTEQIGTLGTRYWQYGYDALSRLTSVQSCTSSAYSSCTTQEATGYDFLNNRTTQTKAGITQTYTQDAANQLLEIKEGATLKTAFVWDANGDLKKKCSGTGVTRTASDCAGSTTLALSFDPLGQLTQAGGESYAYDHEGRRIQKTVAGVATNYLYNGPDIHGEYGSGWGNPQAVYAHGPNWDDPLMRLTGATGGPTAAASYYHADGLGSLVGLSSQAGGTLGLQRFDAWGNKTASTGTIPQYGYTGREPDSTGLIYYRARQLDPTIGQFVSRDPAGMPDGINRYSYVRGNPVMYTDPLGLASLGSAGQGNASAYPTFTGENVQVAWLLPLLWGAGGLTATDAAIGLGIVGTGVAVQSTINNSKGGAGGGGSLAGGTGQMDPCQAFGVGCNSGGSSTQPGNWISTNESMSNRASQYQQQITGRPANQSYQVNGVKFDGYNGQALIDAKGPGYFQFVGPNGQFKPFFTGQQSLVNQAKQQVAAANGTPIQWHVAEPEAATAIRNLFRDNEISGIRVINTPPR